MMGVISVTSYTNFKKQVILTSKNLVPSICCFLNFFAYSNSIANNRGRKHLNEAIIKYYQQNMDFMIEAMKNGLARIEERLQMIKSKNGSKSKERKIANDEAQSDCQK
jgi:hypothetical protein